MQCGVFYEMRPGKGAMGGYILNTSSEHTSTAEPTVADHGIHPKFKPQIDIAIRLGAEPMRIFNCLRCGGLHDIGGFA